jgi:hypothetical protein
MTGVITNPITNIPRLKSSHVLGWSQIWSDQLQAPIDHSCSPAILEKDVCYIEHGVNFGGTLNLFGGATKEIYDRINRLASHPFVVSLDIPMPDWGAQLKKRIGAATTYEAITAEWCDALSKNLQRVTTITQESLTLMTSTLKGRAIEGLTVGDSHSPAFSQKNDAVFRTNGKTLYGCLKRGLQEEFRGVQPFGEVTFCLGNIDIRHHLLRHENCNLEELIKEYVRQGTLIEKNYGCSVSYCAPVPVEYEARRLPKTGYYKGTPFYGSREQRLQLTLQFVELLNKHSNGCVVSPPSEWYEMDGEKFAKTYMENGGSVHLSPEYYRRKDWGITCLA